MTATQDLPRRLADRRESAAIDAVVDMRRLAARRNLPTGQRALYLARARGMVDAIATVTGQDRDHIVEEVESRHNA